MTLSLQFVSLLWMILSGMLIGAIIEGTRFITGEYLQGVPFFLSIKNLWKYHLDWTWNWDFLYSLRSAGWGLANL